MIAFCASGVESIRRLPKPPVKALAFCILPLSSTIEREDMTLTRWRVVLSFFVEAPHARERGKKSTSLSHRLADVPPSFSLYLSSLNQTKQSNQKTRLHRTRERPPRRRQAPPRRQKCRRRHRRRRRRHSHSRRQEGEEAPLQQPGRARAGRAHLRLGQRDDVPSGEAFDSSSSVPLFAS